MSDTQHTQVVGTLAGIFKNTAGLYEGNLEHYYKKIFLEGKNHHNGYHNFRHNMNILWECYQAVVYYNKHHPGQISPREARCLLIAAMYHDFDHSGMMGHDDLNVERAVRGFKAHMLPDDAENFVLVEVILRATQYPYPPRESEVSLLEQIIRDADLSQCLSIAWMQQVIFGLAQEWRKSPIDVLRGQIPFLKSLKFKTEWAEHAFPQESIDAKIEEVKEHLAILDGK